MPGKHATRKIGIVTGGGDAPGLNTVIRAVVMAAANRGWESLGITGGFEGLLPPVSGTASAVQPGAFSTRAGQRPRVRRPGCAWSA